MKWLLPKGNVWIKEYLLYCLKKVWKKLGETELFSYNHILGLLTVFLCYASLLLVARYILHFNPYPFMTLVNLPVLIVIGVIMFGFIVLCYLFHLFLLRHNKEEEIIEGEYQELKDDNNIN